MPLYGIPLVRIEVWLRERTFEIVTHESIATPLAEDFGALLIPPFTEI